MNKFTPYCVLITFITFLTTFTCISGEPIINSISPEDGAKLDSNPSLIINVSNDFPMDIIWYFKEAESEYWEKIDENRSILSGIYKQEIPNGTQAGTNYQWMVNISDFNSSIERTFSFRRIGWQVIQIVRNISFSAPDSIQNLIVLPIEDRGVFKIDFEMVFHNYQDSIKIKIPGRLGNKTYHPNEEGIYEISFEIPKVSSILQSPIGQSSLQVVRTDGKSLDFSDYEQIFTYDKWKTNIYGEDNNLIFEVEYVIDLNIIIIIIAILIIPLLLNIVSLRKNKFHFIKE